MSHDIEVIDFVLLSLYMISLSCALYIVFAHRAYFKDRVKTGVVNLFMVAMLFFITAYIFKMVTVIWIRAATVLEWNDTLVKMLQTSAWTIAQLGTTIGLASLAIVTYTRRYDLFIYLRKIDRKD
ncbi:hypothetical protein [Paenibacillus agricola]|uniref:Uncharacterized protein n=1 Tax=Paenibacillus agricola TaxID=2716264 RepID=A0ABX0J2T5_9BACL|nr:hypothetical protein [Paenibacillus agricola]NHN29434.1 hypothetical protein [Paenibacillus agricola]